MTDSPTILLDWIYYKPVGHAVEVIAAAADYYSANNNMEIHVLLNDQTPVELITCCPWIKQCYAIDVNDVAELGKKAACLTNLPEQWDYIVYSSRLIDNRPSYSSSLIQCHDIIESMTTARLWRGIEGQQGEGRGSAPTRNPFSSFTMKIPEQAKLWAKQFDDHSITFSVLLAGSSHEMIYPPISWWIRLFESMTTEFADVQFIVTGSTNADSGRTITGCYSEDELQTLFAHIPNAVNCYNVGLSNQLALLEMSDIFISPHTGFAFLAPCVGTPWLAISGTRWPDPTYARIPFYAVMPKCPEYPCFSNMLPVCFDNLQKGIRPYCMTSGLEDHIPEVISGARLLMSPDFDIISSVKKYEDLAYHKGVNMDRLYTLGMLKDYLKH